MSATEQPQTQGGPSIDEPEKTGSIERDELFHILRNKRRRFALHHLKHGDEAVDVGDLATQIAAWENEREVEEVTSKQRRRVYNALQQTHVPELEEAGIIEVDRREIELTEKSEELDIYLEVVSGRDIPWSEYYLALGAVSLAVLVVVWLNIGPFAPIPGAAAGMFVAVAFIVSASANYYYQRDSLVGEPKQPPEIRGD